MANLLRSTWLHVAFAFVAMGGWTLFANREHGLAWLSAATQGIASAAITLALKTALDGMGGRFGGWKAYVLPPLVTALAILGVLWVVHTAIGTPEVLQTVSAPWTVSTLYAAIYNADREQRRA